MQILRIFAKSNNKKGRSFFLLPFFVFMVSCSHDLSRYGRVTLHNTADKESFIFSVNDEFIEANKDSIKDRANVISEAENKFLVILLKQKKYCLNKYGTPIFTITSRQEKIFDMTFAHLIEENYNARPTVPRMYFGRCKQG